VKRLTQTGKNISAHGTQVEAASLLSQSGRCRKNFPGAATTSVNDQMNGRAARGQTTLIACAPAFFQHGFTVVSKRYSDPNNHSKL